MRKELFMPAMESEARLLLLIDAFTSEIKTLEGRTKLAKLDFFLRYPDFMSRALKIRNPDAVLELKYSEVNNIETRMVRYRYGPWDPSYYVILGRLIGKGLIETVPITRGLGYRTTQSGHSVATKFAVNENWAEVAVRTRLLRRHFDLKGSTLKDFIYKHFPEFTNASWGQLL